MDVEQIIAETKRQHLSVRELAERSGVSKSTVYRIFNHQVTPDTATLKLLEKALGLAQRKRTLNRHILIFLDFSRVRCYKKVEYARAGQGRRHRRGLHQMRQRRHSSRGAVLPLVRQKACCHSTEGAPARQR